MQHTVTHVSFDAPSGWCLVLVPHQHKTPSCLAHPSLHIFASLSMCLLFVTMCASVFLVRELTRLSTRVCQILHVFEMLYGFRASPNPSLASRLCVCLSRLTMIAVRASPNSSLTSRLSVVPESSRHGGEVRALGEDGRAPAEPRAAALAGLLARRPA